MGRRQERWQLCASVLAQLEAGISPHSLRGSLLVNVQCGSHLTMEEKVQQRVRINFCFRLGKTGAGTYEMLQAAFGESCLIRSKTFVWYSSFKSGRRSFENDPRPGRRPWHMCEKSFALNDV